MCFTGIYAPGHARGRARQHFFTDLHIRCEDIVTPVVLGDFNHTLGGELDSVNSVSKDTRLQE